MRRFIPIILLAMLIGVPIVLRAVLLGSTQTEPQTRPSQPVERLTIITSHNQDIRNEFRWAFDQWHRDKYGQGVELEYLTPGGTQDILRQLTNIYDQVKAAHGGHLPPEDQVDVGIDIAWGGGDFFFNNQLKPLGVLHPFDGDLSALRQAIPKPDLAGVRLYDFVTDKSGYPLPPQWIGICLSSFGIVYNPDLYRSMGLEAPRSWGDLTDPRLSGAVALADPTHSASVSVAYMMILQRCMADAEKAFFALPANAARAKSELVKSAEYRTALAAGWKNGMGQLLLIAANARYFSDAATQIPNDVAWGDAAAGMAIDFYGRVTSQTVGEMRCRFVTPPAATAITPDPVAILYGASGRRLELANHFIEFLLSRQGQRLWILKLGETGGPQKRELHRAPIRYDLYADRTGWSDDIDYYERAGDFNQRGAWMAQMGDLQPIWAAAWIDDRDALRSAYAAVLAVPDATARGRLLARLADLPITMQQVDDLKRLRETLKGDLNLWKAQNRIEWARTFREHYEAVAREAATAPNAKP